MSEKITKTKTIKHNKKASKIRKPITLRLDNDDEVLSKTIYKKDGDFLKLVT